MKMLQKMLVTLIVMSLGSEYVQGQSIARCDNELVMQNRAPYASQAMMHAKNRSGASLVEQVRTTNGWTSVALQQGAIISAVLTTPTGEKEPVTIAFESSDHVRIDRHSGSGESTLLINGAHAFRIHNGMRQEISVGIARAESNYFPFMADLVSRSNHTLYSLWDQMPGSEHEGAELRVYVRPDAASGTPGPQSGYLSESRYFIDSGTLHINETRSCRPSLNGKGTLALVQRKFSAYTTVNGFTYPAHMDQYVGSSLVLSMDIGSVNVSPNFTDQYWDSSN